MALTYTPASYSKPTTDGSGSVIGTKTQTITTTSKKLNDGITLDSSTTLVVVYITGQPLYMLQTESGTATTANCPERPIGTVGEMTPEQFSAYTCITASGTCTVFIEERSS